VILSNIYLHKLDNFAETVLILEYTRGGARKGNPAYRKIADAAGRARKRGDRAALRELHRQQRSLPSRDTHDPGYWLFDPGAKIVDVCVRRGPAPARFDSINTVRIRDASSPAERRPSPGG
jgi:hypothetical protein